MDFDALKDARSDARYIDEYSPAAVEAAWVEPEGHLSAEPWPHPHCKRCYRALLEGETACLFCDIGCPNGCGPLDRDAYCPICGRTTWPNNHPVLHPEERKAA